MCLGITWVAFAAMVYTQRQVQEDLAPRRLLLVVIASLFVFGSTWIYWRAAADLSRYTAVPTTRELMAPDQWLNGGWQRLPTQRFEMAGDAEEPLQLQWACNETGVAGALKAAGWQDAPAWSLAAALGSIAPGAPMQELPALPRFNRGDRSRLVFVRWSVQQPEAREVLRLWRSEFDVAADAAPRWPVWYGAVYRESRRGGHITQSLLRQSVLPPDEFVALLPPSQPKEFRRLDRSRTPIVLMRCAPP